MDKIAEIIHNIGNCICQRIAENIGCENWSGTDNAKIDPFEFVKVSKFKVKRKEIKAVYSSPYILCITFVLDDGRRVGISYSNCHDTAGMLHLSEILSPEKVS